MAILRCNLSLATVRVSGRSCTRRRSTRLPAPDAAPLAIVTHGSDVGRNQLQSWSFSTEAHWLRDNGFAVLALMRRGREPV
jgi:hypothetical protein